MQTPQQLRKQAAELKKIAQYSSGPAYHNDMQRAQALITQANELEQTQDSTEPQRTTAQGNKQRAANLRNKDLAKIHLLSKKAGLDDDGRRDMMEHITGKRSSAKMNISEREKVIAHLQRALPHQKRGNFPGKPNNIDSNPQLQKIEALLSEANRPWSYANAIAKRMFKKDKLEFCSSNDLSGIIAALIINAKKQGRRTS